MVFSFLRNVDLRQLYFILELIDMKWSFFMTKINLREFYPDYYSADYYIDIPKRLAMELRQFNLDEAAYRLRTYRHKAYYSLDHEDGIENHVLFTAAMPDELYERKLNHQQLHAAISQLPEKQAKRIYAYYFLDMDEYEIAKAEGISQQAVHGSLRRARRNLEKILKNIL